MDGKGRRPLTGPPVRGRGLRATHRIALCVGGQLTLVLQWQGARRVASVLVCMLVGGARDEGHHRSGGAHLIAIVGLS